MDSELYIHQVYEFDKTPVFFTQLTKAANILEVEQKKRCSKSNLEINYPTLIKLDLIFREHYQLFFLIKKLLYGQWKLTVQWVFFLFSFLPKPHTIYPIKDAHISEENSVFFKKTTVQFSHQWVYFSYSEEKLHSLQQDTLILPFFQRSIVKTKVW